MASTAVSMLPKAVIMMTTGLFGSVRALSMTRRPDLPGMRRSVTITSNGCAVHEVEGLVGVARHGDVVVILQRLLQAFAGVLLVVDDEDAGPHARHDTRPAPPVNGK